MIIWTSGQSNDFKTNGEGREHNGDLLKWNAGKCKFETRERAYSLGEMVGSYISEWFDETVYVVTTSVKGTSIDEHLDSVHAQSEATVATALSTIPANRVDAFLWHQGEADLGMTVGEYAEKEDTLLSRVRAAPFVGFYSTFVGVFDLRSEVHSGGCPDVAKLRHLYSDNGVTFLPAPSLFSTDDGVHLDPETRERTAFLAACFLANHHKRQL